MIQYLVEFLGTLFFLSIILSTRSPILIALGLFLVMLLGQNISGGHFNPAVSIMFWARGALTNRDVIVYIVAQIFGGLGALFIFNRVLQKHALLG